MTNDPARAAALAYILAHPEDALVLLAEAGISTGRDGGRFAWETLEDGSVRVRVRGPGDEDELEAPRS